MNLSKIPEAFIRQMVTTNEEEMSSINEDDKVQ